MKAPIVAVPTVITPAVLTPAGEPEFSLDLEVGAGLDQLREEFAEQAVFGEVLRSDDDLAARLIVYNFLLRRCRQVTAGAECGQQNGSSIRLIRRRMLDFPQPLSPTRTRVSPSWMSRSTLSTSRTPSPRVGAG